MHYIHRGSGWKHKFAEQIRTFHVIPNKQLFLLNISTSNTPLHHGVMVKSMTTVQIRTFHTIPSNEMFLELDSPLPYR